MRSTEVADCPFPDGKFFDRDIGDRCRSAFRAQMPANTSGIASRHSKVRLIATVVLFGICAPVILVILIGRVPISGHIAVSQDQSDRFGQIMKENGILFWTGIGGLGMMGVQFDNPLTLSTIDDVIIDDARRNKYKAIVRYKCLIPYFDHSVTVN
jgi:hypothetical protein